MILTGILRTTKNAYAEVESLNAYYSVDAADLSPGGTYIPFIVQNFPSADVEGTAISSLSVNAITSGGGDLSFSAAISCGSGWITADNTQTLTGSSYYTTFTFTWATPVELTQADCQFKLSDGGSTVGLYLYSTAIATGYGALVFNNGVAYHMSFILYSPDPPGPSYTELDILYATQLASSTTFAISGNCDSVLGTSTISYSQMAVYADTSTDPFARGVDCGMYDYDGTTVVGDSYFVNYSNPTLTGTHTIFIDDSIWHATRTPNIATTTINYATTTKDWQFSVGYMTTDNPDYSATNAACTSEEWTAAETNWWQWTTCTVVKRYYIIIWGVRDWVKDAVNSAADVLKTTFPINIVSHWLTSWQESESAALPGELAWLDPRNESGNIIITLPTLFGGTAPTWTVWGPGLFGSSTTITGHIRVASKYLMWAAWIFGLFEFGLYVLDLLFGKKEAPKEKI